ncbi:hypothetical protein [Micropruina sp.]|uniref:hypothetical protein n=1 Tax=Micropruina sp. TaxID=2737536 RepID=UPI002626D5D4|nr:hypothetical protein [Micropruina sp.]
MDGIQIQWLCARADADPSAGDPNTTPVHGDTPIDMAAQLRLLIDMFQSSWRL